MTTAIGPLGGSVLGRLRLRAGQSVAVVSAVAVSTGVFVVAAADTTNDQRAPGLLTGADVAALPWPAVALVIGALYATNVLAIDVYARHAEIVLLAQVGWTGGWVLSWVLADAAALGLVAGVLAGLLTATIAMLAGIDLGSALPVGMAVAVPVMVFAVAVIVPAWRVLRLGARPTPVRSPRSAASVSLGVRELAWANIWRSPERTGIGLMAVALAAMGVLPVVVGAVEAPGLDDRMPARLAAVVIVVVISSVTAAHVLHVDAHDRRDELAVLQTVGWDDRGLRRLVLVEAAFAGIGGAVLGVGAAVVVAALRVGELRVSFLVAAAATLVVMAGATVVAAIVPAVAVSRWQIALPTREIH